MLGERLLEDRPSAPADLAGLLANVVGFVRRFVAFPSEAQAVAVALWIAHTHAIEAADVTPYVAVTSPEKRSGKTRLLEVAEVLVPRPLRTANISDAGLFRSIAESRPTILLDEADAIFGPRSTRDDLRALLNAGYRRGAVVVRVEMNGKTAVPQRYDAFGAKAIAAIRDLPDTVADRSIPIRLARRAPGERVERFRVREAEAAGTPLREALERWAAGAVEALRRARPELPEALDDRAQDGWEPLLAIADTAGGAWPARAREAAVFLHGDPNAREETLGLRLLADVRDVFGARDRLTTAELIHGLVELEEGPWAEWWARGAREGETKGSGARLARLLRPYGIRPRDLRTAGGTRKGYHLEDFADTWDRYLPAVASHVASSERDNATPQVDGPFRPEAAEAGGGAKTVPDQQRRVVASSEGDKGGDAVRPGSERCPVSRPR